MPLISNFNYHLIVFQENPLANIKRVDCALLPPTRRTLQMKIRRAQYVTSIWTQATTASPGDGLSPTDYGWSADINNRLEPVWFEGPATPESLFQADEDTAIEIESDSDETIIVEGDYNMEDLSDTDDDPWSEDSDQEDSDQEDEMD